MNRKPFDIADYVSKNNFELENPKKPKVKGKNTFKGYNDIRKTILSEVKIKDGKFDILESMKGEKEGNEGFSPEAKRHFLEIISTYNSYQKFMERKNNIAEIANNLSGIIEAARELTLQEADDWFDQVTIKRNMKQLENLKKEFDKCADEANSLDTRLAALYEDMGHIISRYYEVSDISEQEVEKRLGMKSESINESNEEYVFKPTKFGSKETYKLELSPEAWSKVKHLFDNKGRPKSREVKGIGVGNYAWDLYAQEKPKPYEGHYRIYGVSGDATFGGAPSFFKARHRGNKKVAKKILGDFIKKNLK